jgi:hypothetical protein
MHLYKIRFSIPAEFGHNAEMVTLGAADAVERLRLTVYKGRTEVEVCADLAAGWRRLEKWWGFEESCVQPFGEEEFRCFVKMALWSRRPDLCRNAIRAFTYPPDGNTSAVTSKTASYMLCYPRMIAGAQADMAIP